MSRHRLITAALVVALGGLLAGPAKAQVSNLRSFISVSGSNVNPCTTTSPCQTLTGAVNKTRAGGTIICQDEGLSSTDVENLTILQSVTIDCSSHPYHVATGSSQTTVFNIAAGPADVVIIRGIRIADSKATNAGSNPITGIRINSAGAVYLDDVFVENQTLHGVADLRTGGGTRLFISNSRFINNGGVGILASAGGINTVVLSNVKSFGNKYGLAAAAGNNVVADHSVFSGGSSDGVEADAGAQIAVNDSVMSHNNGSGVTAGGTIRLSNSEVNFNNRAFSGTPITYGNNRLLGNVTLGSTPSPAGSASSAEGQF